ncbi:hypothetical protein AAMO2058_000813000 [Amorphochlora amoebiformis]
MASRATRNTLILLGSLILAVPFLVLVTRVGLAPMAKAGVVVRATARGTRHGATALRREILRCRSTVANPSKLPVSQFFEPERSEEATAVSSSPEEVGPGFLENEVFECSPSVESWQKFNASAVTAQDLINMIQSTIKTPEDALYWAYSLGRVGFFTTNGILGLIAARLTGSIDTQLGSRIAQGATSRIFQETITTFKQDLEWQKDGYFKRPFDLDPRHRQYNPRYVTSRMARFARESTGVLSRRFATESVNTSHWIANKLYPSYYQDTFHYQTDGWLSTDSAKVYEISTETLFLGRQDAMQRSSLVPFSKFMSNFKAENPNSIPKVLEVGAGTGRFATFLKDSYPDMELTVSELSPYYLEEARSNLNYWRRFSQQNNKDHGPPVRFMQAAAEELPVEDGSLDCVVSVYLFHELPPKARQAVFDEVARVLKPGGTFILTDSLQKGDRPILDVAIGGFSKWNEPYYASYLEESFVGLAEKTGVLAPGEKHLSSVTKCISFKRL